MKKAVLFLVTILIMSSVSACTSRTTITTDNKALINQKVHIIVSFNALREFAEAVGGDKVDVKTIIPDGTEPHDFEPTAGDIVELSRADIFVYNGLGMESWVDNALQTINRKDLIAVDASSGSHPIKVAKVSGEGQYDPHLWISLRGAESEAKNVMNALIKADPSNKNYYEDNYKKFYNQLEALFNDYNKKFSNIENKNFVTGHAAFAYLCSEFGLKQNSVEDVFADGEPSAKRLKELIDYCRENKIRTVFIEDMVSPKVSETLASEVGARVEKIHTFESREDGKNYIQCMKENLEEIYNSLK